ncbi:hypothetical protein KIPB_006806, partial [Kipferlia bialata]
AAPRPRSPTLSLNPTGGERERQKEIDERAKEQWRQYTTEGQAPQVEYLDPRYPQLPIYNSSLVGSTSKAKGTSHTRTAANEPSAPPFPPTQFPASAASTSSMSPEGGGSSSTSAANSAPIAALPTPLDPMSMQPIPTMGVDPLGQDFGLSLGPMDPMGGMGMMEGLGPGMPPGPLPGYGMT